MSDTAPYTPPPRLTMIELSSLRTKRRVALSKDSAADIIQLPDVAPSFLADKRADQSGSGSLQRMHSKGFGTF